jgi:hypothetical protein
MSQVEKVLLVLCSTKIRLVVPKDILIDMPLAKEELSKLCIKVGA